MKEKSTHLKRLMRSNISSCEISGYFFCSRIACIVGEVVGGELDNTELDGGDAGRESSWAGMETEDVEDRHRCAGRPLGLVRPGVDGGDDVRDA